MTKRDEELDREAIAAAVMADIEGAAGDGLRELLWRARVEGAIVGAIGMAFGIMLGHALVRLPLIIG